MFEFVNERNCHHGNALPWFCDCSKTVRLSTGFQSRSQMTTHAQLSRRRRKCFFGRSALAGLDRRKRGLAAASGLQRWTFRLKSAGRSIDRACSTEIWCCAVRWDRMLFGRRRRTLCFGARAQ